MTLYIDDVIEAFNEYLDDMNGTIGIEGHEFSPSEVLNTVNFKLYMKELDKYIDNNYTLINHDGETIYNRLKD